MKRQKASRAKCKPSNSRLVIILVVVVVCVVNVEQRFLFCFSSLTASYRVRAIFSLDRSLGRPHGPTYLTAQ